MSLQVELVRRQPGVGCPAPTLGARPPHFKTIPDLLVFPLFNDLGSSRLLARLVQILPDNRKGGWNMIEITRREISMVYRLAQRMTAGGGSISWREDLVGSGLLGLAEAAGRFDPGRGAPFMAMAAISARGRMLDMLRRENRGVRCIGERTRPDTPGGEQILVVRDPATAPPLPRTSSIESTLTRREMVSALRTALDSLPSRERYTLKACVLEGRPTAELAEELGVSRRAINLMCARGRRRLKEHLAHLGDAASDLLG